MIEVVEIAGVVLVQDGGRAGRMHEGVPPGGALVPELLARANAAAGNPLHEAALEIFGSVALATRGDRLEIAADDGTTGVLKPGGSWRLSCAGARVRYAAVRGGLAVPEVLGGRGTLLVAGLGGHEGRSLRKGDVLPVGEARASSDRPPPLPDPHSAIRVVPGPDGCRFRSEALGVLLSSEYRVSPRSDRVGVRLIGPALQRIDDDAAASAPMVRGALQVPASGEPIVLGPDHPTMGGYPVLAAVVAADLGALMMRAPGSAVRFATAFVTPLRRGVI